MDQTYQILQVIGQGTGGIVYKALHTRLNKEVVIKQIKSAAKQTIANRTEVDLLKGLKHTYLPQVLDFIEENGEAYTVMDFIDGADIDVLMKNGRRFRQKEIIAYAIQLCEAVEYLHTRKRPIIHSDIKPGNIMINSAGDICLIDFNVSLVFDGGATVLGGTPGYAPPEQLGVPLSDIGEPNMKPQFGKVTPRADERSDIYSIGATLYYMLTGVKPAANYCNHSIDSMGINVSDGLLHVINKAMSLNPAKRYKSVSEMLSALNNIGKLDKRYRSLKIRREIVMVVAIVLMVGCLYINRLGASKLHEEHETKYSGYLDEIDRIMSAGGGTELIPENADYEKDNPVDLAIAMEPTRISPYYSRLQAMHALKDYEACMNYPDKVLTADMLTDPYNGDDIKANMYILAADSAFELERYKNCIELYRKALFYNEENADCYRDLTISYARTGNTELAESTLEKAEKADVSNDQLTLMRGEICYAKGEFDQAYESFCEAIRSTDNNYIKFRALLICDKMMQANADKIENAPFKMVELLSEQQKTISGDYANIVTEMLANQYYLCGNFTLNPDYYYKAVLCYDKLMQEGQLSYSLKKNSFNIMYSKLEEYERCIELLKTMEQDNPQDYWVWMNYAYTYISMQGEIEDQNARDYTLAYDCYKKADEYYKAYIRNTGVTDANMDSLRNAVDQLIDWGWIKVSGLGG